MNINHKKYKNAVVVYLIGRLDIPQEEEFDNEIKKILNEETSSHFILNLQDVDYVSSSGLGLFVSVMNVIKSRGKEFGICNLNSSVKRIMEIVELNILFHIFKDENEAFEFLKSDY